MELRAVRLAGGDAFTLTHEAELIGVIDLEVAGGRIRVLNLIVNPAKLHSVRQAR